MKKNQKGFTLIELLAVIVILAVIALIATPIVLNIITKARRSAAQDSLYGVIAAARSTYMSSLLDDAPIDLPMTVTCDGTACKYGEGEKDVVSFSGTVPTSGSFDINEEGKVDDVAVSETSSGIVVNGFKCSITDETVKCS